MQLTTKLGKNSEGSLVFTYKGEYFASLEYKTGEKVRRPYEMLLGIMKNKAEDETLHSNVGLKEIRTKFRHYKVIKASEYQTLEGNKLKQKSEVVGLSN